MSDPSKRDTPETEKQNANIERLLSRLPFWRRKKARIVLMRGDDASFQLLTEILLEAQHKRRTGLWTVPLFYLPVILVSWIVLMGILFFFGPPLSTPVFYLLTIFAFCLVPLAVALQIDLPRRREKAALEILFCTEDERSVGPLLESLERQPRALRTKTKAVLARLLPLLAPEALQDLSPWQRDGLHALLDYSRRNTDPELRQVVLAAIQPAGGRSALGYVYLLATGRADTPAARTVQAAATSCLTQLLTQEDFGSPHELPQHINTAYNQMTDAEDIDLPGYFAAMLTVRKLLPRLTPDDYRDLLSERQRRRLSRLARLRVRGPLFAGEQASVFGSDLQRVIVSTAERLGDTCAIEAFQAFVQSPLPPYDASIYAAVMEALRTLEPLAEREKLGQTLLRGASAPDAQPDELLRAAAPNASATDPAELLRATTAQTGKPSPASVETAQTTQLRAGNEQEHGRPAV